MDFDILNETITPLNTTLLTVSGTGAIGLPSGTTAQRPGVVSAGAMRWNSSTPGLEFYNGATWASVGGVSSVALAMPSIFTVTGSPVTSTGTLTATLNTQANNTVFAGPAFSGPSVPSFRTLGLAQNDMNDVLITSAAVGQVLTYSSTNYWVNSNATSSAATANVGVTPTSGGTGWTLVSGTFYTATFTHNLGTTNLSITCYDTNDNSVVVPHYLTTPTANTIVIQVSGNTKTVKIVAVANGLSIAAGASTPSSVITQLNGVQVSAASTILNFTGQAVNVTAATNTSTIAIGSRFTYYANSLDSPNSSDWAINAFAPIITDPTYTSMTQRSMSNTTEQGIGCLVSVPTGATSITFRFKGRPGTAPAAAANVQPRLYTRLIPNNIAMGSWSGGTNLSTFAITANINFQYFVYTVTLASLGLTAGNLYQFEVTRYNTGVTSNLAYPFYLTEMTLEIA
jgi:hypothetical protein